MRIIRTIAASVAATAIALTATPAAGAQDLATLGILDGVVTGVIDNMDCNTLKTTLKAIDQGTEGELLTENTTRNELSRNLQALSGKNISEAGALALPAIRYSGKTADRALQCGIVKQDPAIGGNFAMSSQLNDIAPLLMGMSSKA